MGKAKLAIDEGIILTGPDPEPGLRVDWLRFDGWWPIKRPSRTAVAGPHKYPLIAPTALGGKRARKVGMGQAGPRGVGEGVNGYTQSNGATSGSGAVPGPKIWDSEKSVNTESFFLTTCQSEGRNEKKLYSDFPLPFLLTFCYIVCPADS